MGMKDASLIDNLNPTSIALTTTAIQHCLSVWKIGEFRVPAEFGPGSGAQPRCDTGNINHAVNKAYTDVFRCLNSDFLSSPPEVQAKMIDNICSMIRQRIHSTGMDPPMAQPHHDQGSIDEDFLD